jgi:hypothetical protein
MRIGIAITALAAALLIAFAVLRGGDTPGC